MDRNDKLKLHDITDDDVFKELINIVADVFSNKTEKCALTFELPIESDVLQEIRADAARNFPSSSGSKSDLAIPLRETKTLKKPRKTKRKRKMIEFIAKPSEYTKKRKFKKRFNATAQTMLYSYPGAMRKHKEILKVAEDWDAGKAALLQENLRTNPSENIPGQYNNLYNNFKQVFHSFEDIIKSSKAPILSCELSHHLEEIRNHVEAIRDSLHDADSRGSWEIRASTENSEGPKRKNKVGVKLIRIGAKISRKSSVQITSVSKPRRKSERRRRETQKNLGLDKILTQYERVKKEETAIVRALLGKLGFSKDTKNKKTRSRKNKEGGEDQNPSNDEPSLNLKPKSPQTYSNSSKDTLEHKLSMGTHNLKIKMLATQFKHKSKSPKSKPEDQGQGRNRFDREIKQRRQKFQAKLRRKMKTRESKYSLKISSVFNDIHKEVVGSLRENKDNGDKSEEIEPQEALMRRQSSVERLEQMHSLAEEKLNDSSLKEVQFHQKTEELTYTDKDFHKSNTLESTMLSPEVEELIFKPYRPFNFEVQLPESTSFYSSNLKLDNFRLANTGKSPMNFDSNNFGINHNYVCGYMMDMRGMECDVESSGSMENQPGSESKLKNVFSSMILTNEFQERSSSSRPNNETSGVQSSWSSHTRDVFTENSGEIVEESLLTKPQVLNKNTPKPSTLKKKKRVIKATCALS